MAAISRLFQVILPHHDNRIRSLAMAEYDNARHAAPDMRFAPGATCFNLAWTWAKVLLDTLRMPTLSISAQTI